MSSPKYQVHLSEEQRKRLKKISCNGSSPAKKIRHAQVLLMSDQAHPEGRWTDIQIAEALGMHVNTVARIRKRFALEGEAPALNRRQRITPPVPPKLDGEAQAHLMAIYASEPPEGRTHWTLSLLAQELIHRGIVTQISRETVRQSLKKIKKNSAKTGS